MIVCLWDVETNGLDPKTAQITEIGAGLYDTDGWKPLFRSMPEPVFTHLLYDHTYPPQPSHIVELTGITDEKLKTLGGDPGDILRAFMRFTVDAEYMIAYNVQFDKGMLLANLERHGVIPDRELKFLCGLRDVPYDDKYKCRKLSHLALDHGVTVDPKRLHTAMGDVEVMAELFKQGDFKIQDMLSNGTTPNLVIFANVGYEDRELAKAQRFSWEKVGNIKYEKKWIKVIKKSALESEVLRCSFPIKVLREIEPGESQ